MLGKARSGGSAGCHLSAYCFALSRSFPSYMGHGHRHPADKYQMNGMRVINAMQR